jgi:acyl carrier protein
MKIDSIIAEVFDINICDINEDLTPEDLEKWDSIGQLFLIISIENEFDITLDSNEIFSINSVGDIYNIFRNRGMLEF